MKRFMFYLMAALFVIAPTAAQAQWSPLSSVTLNNNSADAFWDKLSQDGRQCNIGFVISGQATPAGCSNDRPVGYLPLALAVRQEITQFKTTPGFSLFNPGAINVTFYGDIAGQNRDWGWTQDGGATKNSLNGALFSSTTGNVTTINPNAPWSLYVQLTNGSYAYSTGNQFAFFGEDGQFGGVNGKVLYAGIEDINVTGGDKDYNDMFLRLELTSGGDLSVVPEPSTYALMGAGLFGLGIVSRRRKNVA